MRVCHYLELAGPLERSGIETATSHQRQALSDRDEVEVITDPWRGFPARLLRGSDPVASSDVVHCNAIGPGSLAVALRAKAAGTSLVVHAHVTREDFAGSFRGSTLLAPVLGRYLRRFYSLADVVCVPSEYTRSVLRSYPIEAPIRTVTNGVDHDSLSGFERFREPCREAYGLEGIVVATVGNVFERKGLSTFCRLARRLDHGFVWFGPYDRGPLASPAVRRWTGDPPENVTFTGWIEDKRAAFGAGDVFLFPTRVENQGIAVLEAMACGRAVVLRDIPAFGPYTDGKDCLKASSRRGFQTAIERLVDDPDLRRRLGDGAMETAREHRLEVLGDRLAGIYRELSTAAGSGAEQ